MQAANAMTREVVVVPPELSLESAWKIMQRRHIRHLPVVSASTLLGILSDRDVLVRARLEPDGSLALPSMPVATAMSLHPVTCEVDATIPTLARLMIERKLDAIPIVDTNDALVGLVTSSDLIVLLIQLDPAEPLRIKFDLKEEEDLEDYESHAD
jgi:CBS domain-containing protein